MPGDAVRRGLKRALARLGSGAERPRDGATILIYHRVGGGSADERDLSLTDFTRQLDVLPAEGVVTLDAAADRLVREDPTPSIVLTFDDGFGDVYANAWPELRDRRLPFTLYLATDYVGGTMQWDGSTATAVGPALTWDQLAEMVASGLCTVGNHTASHARPERIDEAELDRCSAAVERHLGVRPAHYADPWGIRPDRIDAALRTRFRTAATGRVGRNPPGADPHGLRRIPVRRTDPIEFFRAKIAGALLPERAYAGVVTAAKAVGLRG